MATTGLPLERSVDLRWMPKDCDGQIKMGFNIIANAFKSKVKALEEDLRAANEERSELDEKLAAMHQKLMKLERENLEASLMQGKLAEMEEKVVEKTAELETRAAEHMKREQDLLADNKRLSQHIVSLKKKASQLEAFRRIVVDTIRNEDDFATNELSEKAVNNNNVPGYTCTANRVSVGSDFQPFNRDSFNPDGNSQNDSEGRRLFRHARSKLSVDQFEQFLDNVRRLNAHAVTVEESLSEAEKICGYEHPAIFEEFRNLLLRKGHAANHNNSSTLMGSPLSHC